MTQHTFGIEIETHGVSITRVKSALERAGIRGCQVKPDGTPNVDAEIVLPPLGDCQVAFEYLQSVCTVLDQVGCQINRQCGLHVHVSNAELRDTTPAAFTGASIAHTETRGGFLATQNCATQHPQRSQVQALPTQKRAAVFYHATASHWTL